MCSFANIPAAWNRLVTVVAFGELACARLFSLLLPGWADGIHIRYLVVPHGILCGVCGALEAYKTIAHGGLSYWNQFYYKLIST